MIKLIIRELINQELKRILAADKEESAALILFEYASGLDRTAIYVNYENEVSDEIMSKFKKIVDKYINENIPVQYIIGHTNFYGYEFKVNENCLIPRPETAELVENILFYYDSYFSGEQLDLVDIGTGSGCIATTLALEEPRFNVSATDISAEAVELAGENAKNLGAKVDFYVGDMLEPVYGKKFDILVSNPPYIPKTEIVDSLVLDNEPNVALFGGEDGLKFYRIILENANKILKEKAIIGFEHAFDTAKDIRDIAKEYFLDALIFTKKDMQQKDRMTFIIRGFKK